MGPLAIIAAAGAVTGAAGNIYEGQMAAKAGKLNAANAKRNAYLVRKQAEEESRNALLTGRKVLGQMRANYGASGVTMEGSPLDVMEESARAAEQDALNIKYQGELQAQSYEFDAKMSRIQGNSAQNASYFKAASSLTSGGSEAYKLSRT